MPTSTYLGIKLSVIVAGFFGALVSLSFIRDLTRYQMLAAVGVGTISANYLTPVFHGAAVHYLGASQDAEGAAAFVIGVTAMNIIPAMLKLSENFKRSPGSLLSIITGKSNDSADR